jgi:hypothetical protein
MISADSIATRVRGRAETIARVGRRGDTIRVSYPDGKRAAFSPDDPLVTALMDLLERIRAEHGRSNW